MSTLYEELRQVIDGEVRFDPILDRCTAPMPACTRSTDRRCHPQALGDVVATVDIARRHQVPVLPRGGGTSLAGQTVGHAGDGFFKYMNQILS
jgi:FAD/FMN-containing dehydrogenase